MSRPQAVASAAWPNKKYQKMGEPILQIVFSKTGVGTRGLGSGPPMRRGLTGELLQALGNSSVGRGAAGPENPCRKGKRTERAPVCA